MQKCKMVTAWETTYTEKKECETQNKDECLTVPVEKTRVEEKPTEVSKHYLYLHYEHIKRFTTHCTRRGRKLDFGFQREFQHHMNPHGVGFQKI